MSNIINMTSKENFENNNQLRDITRDEARKILKEDMALILANIKNFMSEKSINQKELAYRIGSEACHVSRMFKNPPKNGLTINVLGRIAKALDVKLYQITK